MDNDTPLIIHLENEEWDLVECERLEKLLRPAYDCANVVIDMTAVTYIDSSCLQKFIAMRHERMAHSGFPPARFVIPSHNIRRLFAMVGLDEIWPIFESLPEACNTSTAAE